MTQRVRNISICVLGVLALASTPFVSEAQPHHAVNLSLWYPLSINSDPHATSNVRLALIHGRQGSVRGLDVTGIAGILHDDMRGLQLTGIYSHVGGAFRGVALTGFANYFTGEGRGLMWAPVNLMMGEYQGLQLSAFVNYQLADLRGLQFSGAFNLVEGMMHGIQVSSFANATTEGLRGVQLAAGLNIATETSSGVQVATVNLSQIYSGIQVGFFNSSGTIDGVQIGALNWVGQHNGLPIGFVNIANNGNVDWVTYVTNVALLNTGVRTRVNDWVSVFSVGTNDIQSESEDESNPEAEYDKTWTINWHFGRRFSISDKLDVTPDIGIVHIIPKANPDPAVNDRLQPAGQLRLIAEYRPGAKVAIFGGGGASLRFSEYSSDAETQWDPVLVLGISLF